MPLDALIKSIKQAHILKSPDVNTKSNELGKHINPVEKKFWRKLEQEKALINNSHQHQTSVPPLFLRAVPCPWTKP